MRRFSVMSATAAVVLALVAAGCGGSDNENQSSTSSAGSSNKPSGVQAGTGTRQEQAAAAGKKAAAAAGGQVALPAKKAGILQILGAIESAQRAENTITDAIKSVGWTTTVCDAQGDPTKMASCGDSLLDRNVDVMFVIGVEPSLIKSQLRKAKAKNVPVVEFSGQVTPDPLWAGRYYPDEAKAGQILGDSFVKKLSTAAPAEVSVADYPAIWAKARTDEFKKAVAASGGDVKITANSVTDATNLVQGTQKTVTDQLTQNPDLKGFWFAFDSAGQAGSQAVAAKYAGKTFPDRPWVVTFHADLGTQDLIRKGAIDEVLDVPYDAAGYIAVDQAAEYFARKTPFDETPAPAYGGFEIFDYALITKDNLPPKGQYRTPKNDFVTFFKTKWKDEFGASGGA
jgi:ABC-type sugar transport system substrate-binding protein